MNKEQIHQLNDKELAEFRMRVEREVIQLDNIQLAKKIQLNSAYGALA